jgi:hypothetical protein
MITLGLSKQARGVWEYFTPSKSQKKIVGPQSFLVGLILMGTLFQDLPILALKSSSKIGLFKLMRSKRD